MEIKLITRDNYIDELRMAFDEEYSRFHTLIFQVIHLYEGDHGIDSYLSEANMTPRQVQKQFQEILTRHELMKKLYYAQPTLLGTMGRTLLYMNQWMEERDTTKFDSKKKAIWVVEVLAKIGLSYRHFFMNYRSQNNINNSPKRLYEHVWAKINIRKVRDPEGLKEQLQNTKKQLAQVLAAVMCGQSWDSEAVKRLSFGASVVQFALMGDSAMLKTLAFYRDPKVQDAKALLNTAESGVIKILSRLGFQDIKMKRKIWVPANGILEEDFDIHKKTDDKIQIRILCHEQIVFHTEGSKNKEAQERKEWETIIVYIHGGAFMGSSSRSAQGYTRKWANQLKVPVFCIDYRMPPDHPYPGPIYDCYQAYQFIASQLHRFTNVRPKKIYLVGDSAGGNLCCSLIALRIKNKLSLPEGLLMPFPALDLRRSCTESAKHMMDDVLLWPSMIRLVCKAYLDNNYGLGDEPLASPCLLTQEFVSGVEGDMRFPLKWPRTIMTMGNKDPLKDGAILMMQRMVQSGIDCEMTLYEGLGHALVGLGKVLQKGERPDQQPIKMLRQLMNISQEP